jgi:hypothetical protein
LRHFPKETGTNKGLSHNLRERTQDFYWLSCSSTGLKSDLARYSPLQPSPDRSDDMKICARNVFKGKIMEVTKGATTAARED